VDPLRETASTFSPYEALLDQRSDPSAAALCNRGARRCGFAATWMAQRAKLLESGACIAVLTVRERRCSGNRGAVEAAVPRSDGSAI